MVHAGGGTPNSGSHKQSISL